MGSKYILRGCTVADGPAIAANNVPAYWEDKNWVLIWENKTCDYVTAQSAKRQPTLLLGDREHRRHQVAIDPATGRIVGYARWALPDRLVNEWLECQVPAVSAEDDRRYAQAYASADFQGRKELDELDVPVVAMKNKLRARHEYIELMYLAVHPEFKGQGIATQLVASGIARGEENKVRVFVLAFRAALGVYQRLGFQMLDQIVQDDSRFGGPGNYGTYFLEWVPADADAVGKEEDKD